MADVIVRTNMKARTIRQMLKLLRVLLPSENTLPTTIDDLFDTMLSCNYFSRKS